MSKYEDDAIELIKRVAKNSHHTAAKSFERGDMPKGWLINTKSAETIMLLEKNRQNSERLESPTRPTQHPQRFWRTPTRLPTRSVTMCQLLKIQPSRVDCLVIAIQGQGMYRQCSSGGLTQQGWPSYPGSYRNYYNKFFFNKNPSKNARLGGTKIKISSNMQHPSATTSTTLHKSKTVDVCPNTTSLQSSPTTECTSIRLDPRSNLTINGANELDELTRGQDIRLHQDKRAAHDS